LAYIVSWNFGQVRSKTKPDEFSFCWAELQENLKEMNKVNSSRRHINDVTVVAKLCVIIKQVEQNMAHRK